MEGSQADLGPLLILLAVLPTSARQTTPGHKWHRPVEAVGNVKINERKDLVVALFHGKKRGQTQKSANALGMTGREGGGEKGRHDLNRPPRREGREGKRHVNKQGSRDIDKQA